MSETIEDLKRLKDKIEKSKTERSRLEGELRALKSQMEEVFGTSDPDKIKDKLEKLRTEVERLRKQVEDGVKEIEEEING